MNIHSVYRLVLLCLIYCSCNEKNDDLNIVRGEFEASDSILTINNEVQFLDKSSGEPNVWIWGFEGGNPSQSFKKNPLVSYEKTGSFDVSLIVGNDTNLDTVVKSNFVKVNVNTIVPNGIMSYFPLDGNVIDKGILETTAIAVGASPSKDRFNNSNKAYFFDGMDDYIDIENPFSVEPEELTITFWMRNLSLSSNTSQIISFGKNTLIRVFINDQKLYFGAYFYNPGIASKDYWRTAETNIPPNQWIFIACRYKAKNVLEVFIGNELKGRTTISRKDIRKVSDIGSAMGCYNHPDNKSEFWNGYLDEVRMYDRYLNNEEIKLINQYE